MRLIRNLGGLVKDFFTQRLLNVRTLYGIGIGCIGVAIFQAVTGAPVLALVGVFCVVAAEVLSRNNKD